jgi:hypothetical protein
MNGLIDPDGTVVRLDADAGAVELVGRVAGAAGAVGVTLLSGVDVDLDAADPVRLVAVTFPWDGGFDPATRSVAERLVGTEVADILEAARTGTPRRLERELRRRGSYQSQVDADLAKFVLLCDDSGRIGTGRLHRAVCSVAAHLDAAVLQLGTPGTSDELDEAVGVLAGVDGVDLAGLSAPGRRAVTATLRELQRSGLAPNADAALDALILLLDGHAATHAMAEPVLLSAAVSDAALPQHMFSRAQTRAASPPPVIVVPGALPGVLADGPAPAAARVDPSNVEVRIDGFADRAGAWWARARRISDNTPVAAAPMRPQGSDAVALLLVPPGEPVEVDVTGDLAEPWPDPTHLATAEAFAHGRAAARAERLGDTRVAADRWQRCAAAHDTAGDVERSKMASARRSIADRPLPAHLGDLLTPTTRTWR